MDWIPAVGVPRAGLAGALIVVSVAVIVAAENKATGAIAGTVMTKESSAKPIRVTIDPGICGTSLPDNSIATNAAGQLANVVVTIAGVKAQAPAEVAVANEKCAFLPRVSILRAGGAVKMSSRDATLHTMHAAGADGRAFFNVSLPIPNVTISRPLNRAGVVTLSCSTHTWMRGYVVITDELAAVSDASGAFRLEGVPAGTHELRIWHEVLKSVPVKVVVRESETATVNLMLAR